jgi:hypothetical protein
LRGSAIDDATIDDLVQIDKLQSIFLTDSQVTKAGIQRLAELPNLQYLNLSCLNLSTSNIDDAALGYLKEMPSLTTLGLVRIPGITDGGLEQVSQIENLKELVLAVAVSDAGVAHLKKLPHLTKLVLSGTRVTSKGVDDLKEALPHCTIIVR